MAGTSPRTFASLRLPSSALIFDLGCSNFHDCQSFAQIGMAFPFVVSRLFLSKFYGLLYMFARFEIQNETWTRQKPDAPNESVCVIVTKTTELNNCNPAGHPVSKCPTDDLHVSGIQVRGVFISQIKALSCCCSSVIFLLFVFWILAGQYIQLLTTTLTT